MTFCGFDGDLVDRLSASLGALLQFVIFISNLETIEETEPTYIA